jgi:hypothetical protein
MYCIVLYSTGAAIFHCKFNKRIENQFEGIIEQIYWAEWRVLAPEYL